MKTVAHWPEGDLSFAPVMYSETAEGLLAQNLWQPEELNGKRILILGGLGDTTNEAYAAQVIRNYLIELGGRPDIVGEYRQIPGNDTLKQHLTNTGVRYDHIVFLEGLEQALSPNLAANEIYSSLPAGGKLLIIGRTPLPEGAVPSIRAADDRWRFTTEDLSKLFPAPWFSAVGTFTTQPAYFAAACFRKEEEGLPAFSVTTHFNVPEAHYLSEREVLANPGYFAPWEELEEIGRRFRTDKSGLNHNYLNKYELFLAPLKNQEFCLLELGIFKGASLRMWREYFPQATVYGVDISTACLGYDLSGITPLIMDLSSADNLAQLKRLKPRLIIDDASHVVSHQMLALTELFPALPGGGIYILEDIETSFFPELPAGYRDMPLTAYDFCQRIIKVVAAKRAEESCDEFSAAVNAIGLRTEMAAVIKGSVILVKR